MVATDKDPLVLSCVGEGKTYLADFQVGFSSKYQMGRTHTTGFNNPGRYHPQFEAYPLVELFLWTPVFVLGLLRYL